jgi:hypothetical protein
VTDLASIPSAWVVTASLAAGIWDAGVFEADLWKKAMYALHIALTFGGAMLLMYELRARKLGERIPERTRKRVAIVMSVLAFGVYYDFFNPKVRYPEYYHRHEFFHYYLGSKYFEELKYKSIYECAAAAEIDLGRGSQVMRRELRDLRVNLIKPVTAPDVQQHIQECREAFAPNPQRWDAFKKDVDWFYNSSRGSYWDNMQKDHGYNPPPVWTMGGKFFSQFGTAGDGFFKTLSAIDVLLQAGAMLLVFWAFGWRIGAIATIFWGANAPADFYWTGGAFLRQDWFFLLVAAACFARKRWFVLSGAALTYSALLRVFPMLFFAGPGILVGLHLLRQIRQRARGEPAGVAEIEKSPAALRGYRDATTTKVAAEAAPGGRWWSNPIQLLHPDHRKFLAGCIVAAGILIPVSVIVAGPDSYREFVAHIGTHKGTPLTNHMGLQTMLVHDWDGRMRFTRDDNLDDPFQMWKQGRLDRHKATKLVQYAILLAMLGWMVWALRRTKLLWVGMGLSCLFAMSAVELTCYYFSMYILAAPLAKARRGLGPVVLIGSGASQIIGSAGGAHSMFYWIDDKFTAQSYLWFLLGALLLYGYSRPFGMERLKAWWAGRPEPRTARPPRPDTPAPAAAE